MQDTTPPAPHPADQATDATDGTDAAYAAALRRVHRKLGFLSHLCVYLLVNAGLVSINLATSHRLWWCLGPLLGWGIGVLFHALSVFGRFPAGWKQAMIARELERR